MEESTNVEFDDAKLKEIKQKIAHAVSDIAAGRYDRTWELNALQYCVSIIEDFKDENDSLWFMLDEMKKSRWTAGHSAELERAIDKQLAALKMMQMRKGEA
tara:strand:+ start:75 stop:377 length:303 start_codon:yes stop_codon:yes gene_type:complete